jgi:hypothetical protein
MSNSFTMLFLRCRIPSIYLHAFAAWKRFRWKSTNDEPVRLKCLILDELPKIADVWSGVNVHHF